MSIKSGEAAVKPGPAARPDAAPTAEPVAAAGADATSDAKAGDKAADKPRDKAADTTGGKPDKAAKSKSRMYHVDFMRVVTFTCVVAVHATGQIMDEHRMPMASFALLTHFTRYAFIFITAFVLFFGYYRKDVRAVDFWRRRFGLVVLPYLVWTAVYCLVHDLDGSRVNSSPAAGPWAMLYDYVARAVTGNGEFQLYFLLVSMQFYFLFPAMRWLVRKTEGHHWWLLAAATAVQLGYMAMVSFLPMPESAIGVLWRHSWVTFPMYSLFITLGSLWAVHYKRVHEWVLGHKVLLWTAAAVGLVATMGIFAVRVKVFGEPPFGADSAMHPDVVPWALGSIAAMYLGGWAWSLRRGDGKGAVGRIVDAGSVRAFGVFAVHPLVLWLLFKVGFTGWLLNATGHSVIRVPVLVLSTIVVSVVFVEVFLRSPASRLLVARERMPLPARLRRPATEAKPATDSA